MDFHSTTILLCYQPFMITIWSLWMHLYKTTIHQNTLFSKILTILGTFMEQKVRNFRLSNGSFFINLTGLTGHQVLREHRVFYLTNIWDSCERRSRRYRPVGIIYVEYQKCSTGICAIEFICDICLRYKKSTDYTLRAKMSMANLFHCVIISEYSSTESSLSDFITTYLIAYTYN